MARYVPEYWSVCCGARVDYIGYYRCSSCETRVEFGYLGDGVRGRPGGARRPAGKPDSPAARPVSTFDIEQARRNLAAYKPKPGKRAASLAWVQPDLFSSGEVAE